MNKPIVVFGYGPVGKLATEGLVKRGYAVMVAQRTEPTDLTPGATLQRCDVLDGEAVRQAVAGAEQIVVSIGFPYDGQTWRKFWPQAMTNLIAACAASGARMVFVDNLYMYGPQVEPLREDMPLTAFGVKPAVRSEITRIWMAARDAGRVRVAALRAPDFYGPGVSLSHLGDVGFGAIAKGHAASIVIPADIPHAFAYVPDLGRAVVTLLEAPDEDFGQVWHAPCAPTRTARQILELGANALGTRLRLHSLPLWLLPVVGIASPFLREVAEMRFTFDRPYHVDARKFMARFWSDVTPFEAGAPATTISFKPS